MADILITPKGIIKVDNLLGEYYSNIPLAHTHMPDLQTPEVYFFSVLWDSLTVPGQQLFVVNDYDIPLRRFLLVCFIFFFNTAD